MGSRGISSMKSIVLGVLNLASLSAQKARISCGQLVGGLDALCGLDHRLHLFAPVLVGDAEHGGVAHLRMRQQHALDLGRVDVHAAGDDHVDLAVAQEQVAVFVEQPMSPTVKKPPMRFFFVFSLSLWYSKSAAASPCRRCR